MTKFTQQEAILIQLGIFAKALTILMGKREDYSGKADPFANLRMSEFVGVEPWRGVMVRNMDKFSRRRFMMEAGGEAKVKDESFLDTLADSVNYVCIEGSLELEELPFREEMVKELSSLAEDLPNIVAALCVVGITAPSE